MPKPRDVDAYIAGAPKEARPKLEEVRAVIRAAVPQAVEGISWGVPFYKYRGQLGGFAAYKKHVSFGATALIAPDDRAALEARGYQTGKKTVRIGFDQKVPAAVLRKILKAQAKANEANAR